MPEEPRRRRSDHAPRYGGHDTAVTVRDMVLDHETRLTDVEDWRLELRGAFRLMQVVLGASLVSAFLSIAAVIGVVLTATQHS